MTSTDREYATTWRSRSCGCPAPVCGLEYVRESEEDRRIHRARHRQVLKVYEPKPDLRLAVLYREHGAFVPVDSRSPRWLHNRLEGMAKMFRRELGYDFPPYSADESEPCPHWLIATADGRPIGVLSARWREYSDAPGRMGVGLGLGHPIRAARRPRAALLDDAEGNTAGDRAGAAILLSDRQILRRARRRAGPHLQSCR
jgi:hypothetical protein